MTAVALSAPYAQTTVPAPSVPETYPMPPERTTRFTFDLYGFARVNGVVVPSAVPGATPEPAVMAEKIFPRTPCS